MTPKEREETKKLMLEAKRREEESEGKFIYRVRAPPREPIHKEGSKNNLAKQSETRVHSFNRKPHNFVNSSSHKLNVKRSLHKLETINCIYTNADCLTNKINELRLS